MAQVYGQLGNKVPDVDEPKDLRHFFDAIQTLHAGDLLQSYHDVSDGGLVTTLLEMAFAGHCGVNIQPMICRIFTRVMRLMLCLRKS